MSQAQAGHIYALVNPVFHQDWKQLDMNGVDIPVKCLSLEWDSITH